MKSAHLARLTGAAAFGLAWLVPAHAEITVTTWSVPASRANKQALQARYIPCAPIRKSAFDVIREGEPWCHTGERVMPYLPSRPDSPDRAIVVDPR